MEHAEKKEALNAIDGIAAEIHEEYVKVGQVNGHKLPSWTEMPEEAKTMSRTLARLMLSKMEKVYMEARDKAMKGFEEKLAAVKASTPAPAPLKPVDIQAVTTAIAAEVAATLDRIEEIKVGNPLERGIDAAIELFSQKLALEVLQSQPELTSRLKENVIEALTSGLFGNNGNHEKED